MPQVPGTGPRNAKIMAVGEAPAKNEGRLGYPFAGKAGDELNGWLSSASIERDEIYLTNVSLEPVNVTPKDRHFFLNGVPTPDYIVGIGKLIEDIKEIKPNVVVALGNYALWALMQHQGITKWRGSILWSDLCKVKVIPIIHPSAIMRGAFWERSADEPVSSITAMRPVCIWDLERAREQSEFPECRLTPRQLNVAKDSYDLAKAREWLFAGKQITIDIETYGGDNLACIGFGTEDPTVAWCVPYTEDFPVIPFYKEMLECDLPKVGQNLMFDACLLDHLGLRTQNIQHDTMLAQHILHTDMPKGLDFLCSVWSDIPYYKDEGKEWKEKHLDKEAFFLYNCKDICATTDIANAQNEYFAESPSARMSFKRTMALFDFCRQATDRGMRINHGLLQQKIEELDLEVFEDEKAFALLIGAKINVRSHTQVKALLNDQYGFNVPNTRQEVLMNLAAQNLDPVPVGVVNIRRKKKLRSNYYTENIVSPDGRVRYEFKLAGTKTGRLAAQIPRWGPGVPIQTVPIKARDIFIPDNGYVFIEEDQVQAEAVVTAWLAQDPLHMECFRAGKDVHRVTACLLFDRPIGEWEQIDKDGPDRDIAKRCNHAFNYAMWWFMFMLTVNKVWDPDDPESLHLSEEQAKAIHSKYHAVRPGLHNYWDWVAAQLRDDRTLTTPLGRERVFLADWSDSMLKDAYSWIPQCTVGESQHIAVLKTMNHPEIKRMGVKFMTQTHDSALYMVPTECTKEAGPIILRQSEVPLLINQSTLAIPIDGSIGDNWNKKTMDSIGSSRKTCVISYEEYQQLLEESVEWLLPATR